MNETNTSSAPEQSGAPSIASFEERSASVFGRTTNDAPVAPSDPAGEASSLQPENASTAGSEGAPDPLAAERAERRKRLDALTQGERRRVDEQAKYRQAEQATKRAEAAERERDELRQRMSGYVDPTTFADPAKFFEVAQSHVKDPKRIGEWLRKQAESPELIAAEYAQKAVDPQIQELRKQISEQNEALQRMAAEREKQSRHAAEDAAAVEFASFTEQQANTSPLASRFLQTYGHDEFKSLATGIVGKLPHGAGYQDLLDAIEDQLSPLSKMFSPATGAPQQRQAPHLPNHAAAKAPTTVSNQLAQGRASVVDEERDWASLPFEERSRRAFGL